MDTDNGQFDNWTLTLSSLAADFEHYFHVMPITHLRRVGPRIQRYEVIVLSGSELEASRLWCEGSERHSEVTTAKGFITDCYCSGDRPVDDMTRVVLFFRYLSIKR